MLGIVMPVGKSLMYIPDSNDGPSGPWTEDIKIIMVLLIMSAALFLIGVIIELARGFTMREILSINENLVKSKFLTIYSSFMTISFYTIWGLTILGYIGYLIYSIL
jgi:hypothetical protein